MSRTATYDVIVGKIATIMEANPPSGIGTGPYSFAGYLKRADTLAGIGGKNINLVIDGVVASSTTTDSYGYWSFVDFYLLPGTHTLYAEFPGDATYEGCSPEPRLSNPSLAPLALLGVTIGGLLLLKRRRRDKRCQ